MVARVRAVATSICSRFPSGFLRGTRGNPYSLFTVRGLPGCGASCAGWLYCDGKMAREKLRLGSEFSSLVDEDPVALWAFSDSWCSGGWPGDPRSLLAVKSLPGCENLQASWLLDCESDMAQQRRRKGGVHTSLTASKSKRGGETRQVSGPLLSALPPCARLPPSST